MPFHTLASTCAHEGVSSQSKCCVAVCHPACLHGQDVQIAPREPDSRPDWRVMQTRPSAMASLVLHWRKGRPGGPCWWSGVPALDACSAGGTPASAGSPPATSIKSRPCAPRPKSGPNTSSKPSALAGLAGRLGGVCLSSALLLQDRFCRQPVPRRASVHDAGGIQIHGSCAGCQRGCSPYTTLWSNACLALPILLRFAGSMHPQAQLTQHSWALRAHRSKARTEARPASNISVSSVLSRERMSVVSWPESVLCALTSMSCSRDELAREEVLSNQVHPQRLKATTAAASVKAAKHTQGPSAKCYDPHVEDPCMASAHSRASTRYRSLKVLCRKAPSSGLSRRS